MGTQQAKPTDESLAVGYDTTSVDVRSVALIGLGLVFTIVFVMLVAWWLTGAYSAEVPPVAAPFPPEQSEQPQPRLQANPSQDWQQQQQQARERLTSYDWIDREQGTVRIPVDRAIEVLVEEGLPVREQPAAGGNTEEK